MDFPRSSSWLRASPPELRGINAAGTTPLGHDARGNVSAIASFAYDPLGRLYYRGSTGEWWDHAGGQLSAEVNHYTGAITRRYVHGPGADEPLVQYEGSGITGRRYHHADERGSVIAQSNDLGGAIGITRYDEYGHPQGGTVSGRFGYTGQVWLPDIGMSYYKARIYHPRLGRFMQTDPIGYGDGMNLYAYVGNDPVNNTDPTGLQHCVINPSPSCRLENSIVVTGYGMDRGLASLERLNLESRLGIGTGWNGGGEQTTGNLMVVTGTRVRPQPRLASQVQINPSAFCRFLLENVGPEPISMISGILGTALIGNQLDRLIRRELRRSNLATPAINAIIESNGAAARGARAGRIGGYLGAVAGAAAGVYFNDEFERFINRTCGAG